MKKGFLDGYKTYDTAGGFGNAKEWKNAFHKRMSSEEAEAILKQESETPYAILGIPTEASQSQIKKAFRQKMMEWHPDRNQHRAEQATTMTQKVIAAYTLLIK